MGAAADWLLERAGKPAGEQPKAPEKKGKIY
jgi:hypothetical protein